MRNRFIYIYIYIDMCVWINFHHLFWCELNRHRIHQWSSYWRSIHLTEKNTFNSVSTFFTFFHAFNERSLLKFDTWMRLHEAKKQSFGWAWMSLDEFTKSRWNTNIWRIIRRKIRIERFNTEHHRQLLNMRFLWNVIIFQNSISNEKKSKQFKINRKKTYLFSLFFVRLLALMN